MRGRNYEREFCDFVITKGYHAERIAGSGLRRESVCDAVLIKDGKAYLVEIKSTRDKVYYLSDKQGVRERIKELIKVSKKCGAIPLLAVRFKGKNKWVVKRLNYRLKKVDSRDKSLI
ncbi:hypothetical protein HRbin06_00358 [archaeon HR06]|nr:hypothetical protein HRbin06_00358 [archaeon HR06]